MQLLNYMIFMSLIIGINTVYASSDSHKSKEFYLCVKVKKNPVEQCSNKIFGKKDSLRLFSIAKAQVNDTKPRVNQQSLNYKRLQSLIRSPDDQNN